MTVTITGFVWSSLGLFEVAMTCLQLVKSRHVYLQPAKVTKTLPLRLHMNVVIYFSL